MEIAAPILQNNAYLSIHRFSKEVLSHFIFTKANFMYFDNIFCVTISFHNNEIFFSNSLILHTATMLVSLKYLVLNFNIKLIEKKRIFAKFAS